MENLIENKEKAQFLSMVIKKISKDRLSAKEMQTYKYLREKIDPENKMELELTAEWKKAEDQSIAEKVLTSKEKNLGFSFKKTKNGLITLMGKVISFFM
jgi:hypothetical protein